MPLLSQLVAVGSNPFEDLTVVLRGQRASKALAVIDRVAGDVMVSAIVDVNVRDLVSNLLMHPYPKRPELYEKELGDVFGRSGVALGKEIHQGKPML